MRMKVKSAAIAVVVLLGALFVGATPAQAGGSCYGASCNGKNPTGTSCERDARTVMAMDVQGSGMLELRYSDSCKANWGRFSSYWAYDITNALAGTAISHAAVYTWNPNQALHGVAAERLTLFTGSSWWTSMVDGTITACTGVELFAQDTSEGGMYTESRGQGWVGNLCG
jgi:hypothetical protein